MRDRWLQCELEAMSLVRHFIKSYNAIPMAINAKQDTAKTMYLGEYQFIKNKMS